MHNKNVRDLFTLFDPKFQDYSVPTSNTVLKKYLIARFKNLSQQINFPWKLFFIISKKKAKIPIKNKHKSINANANAKNVSL